MSVHHAADGPEALDFLFGTGIYVDRPLDVLPRLILLDLWLPKVNGLEVLRIVKSYMRTQVIPVVVLTTSVEDKALVESYRLGVNSYIEKPFDLSEFRQAIRTIAAYWLTINETAPDDVSGAGPISDATMDLQ